jgi:hypothetical protein
MKTSSLVLDETRHNERRCFFVAFAYFVLGAWLVLYVGLTRIFLATTPAGSQRINVLGALHAVTCEIITFTNGYRHQEGECCHEVPLSLSHSQFDLM